MKTPKFVITGNSDNSLNIQAESFGNAARILTTLAESEDLDNDCTQVVLTVTKPAKPAKRKYTRAVKKKNPTPVNNSPTPTKKKAKKPKKTGTKNMNVIKANERKSRAFSLRKKGNTIAEIAKIMDIHVSTVYEYFGKSPAKKV